MSLSFGAESVFGFEELFFSRTNHKGIIESGNSVFQRVSRYEWDEILNKPHNVIRHPGMPKAVFHLLWETILAGTPIGAYVVNQAKDGSHYWVFAIVTPIEGGFLSVRLKPSSPIFKIIKDKYSEILEIEKSNKIPSHESKDILLEAIKRLNFRNYRHFMTEALTQELEHRQTGLGLPAIGVVTQLREVLKLGTLLHKKCEEIFSAYNKFSLVPLNLEIQAARIGQEAAPIAVISSQYDDLAKQIHEETKKFTGAGDLVREKVEACQFDVCNSLLQKEMYNFFKNEDRPTPIQKEKEMNYLESLGRDSSTGAKKSLQEIDLEFGKFKLVYEEVRKLSTALEIVSISGKIEAAKIVQSSGDLLNLLEDLSIFNVTLKEALKEIDDIGDDLVYEVREMRSELV